MSDVFTKAKRSDVMSRIRSRGNKDTELALMRAFRAEGITGWRKHVEVRAVKVEWRGKTAARTSLFSPRPFRVRPDFAFRRQRVVVFVDGCFWHGCPKHSNMPANNRVFWTKKLTGNQTRDRLVTRTLRKDGWRVVRVWEHDLKKPARVLARIRKALSSVRS